MAEAALACRRVWKLYGPEARGFLDRHGPAPSAADLAASGLIPAVADASLEVGRGEIFVIMGLSGSGKSTLVRCLSRLVEPTAGEILFEGRDLLRASEREMIQLRRHRMGMVFQHFALLPHLTVLGNVAFPLDIQGLGRPEREARAREMIELVGLKGREGYFPRELSGGQQQRVGIARSLAANPELWFLDEPFSALDPLIRREMQDEFLRLQSVLRKTIVFITHDFDEAVRLADRIAIMRDGRIVQTGQARGADPLPGRRVCRRVHPRRAAGEDPDGTLDHAAGERDQRLCGGCGARHQGRRDGGRRGRERRAAVRGGRGRARGGRRDQGCGAAGAGRAGGSLGGRRHRTCAGKSLGPTPRCPALVGGPRRDAGLRVPASAPGAALGAQAPARVADPVGAACLGADGLAGHPGQPRVRDLQGADARAGMAAGPAARCRERSARARAGPGPGCRGRPAGASPALALGGRAGGRPRRLGRWRPARGPGRRLLPLSGGVRPVGQRDGNPGLDPGRRTLGCRWRPPARHRRPPLAPARAADDARARPDADGADLRLSRADPLPVRLRPGGGRARHRDLRHAAHGPGHDPGAQEHPARDRRLWADGRHHAPSAHLEGAGALRTARADGGRQPGDHAVAQHGDHRLDDRGRRARLRRAHGPAPARHRCRSRSGARDHPPGGGTRPAEPGHGHPLRGQPSPSPPLAYGDAGQSRRHSGRRHGWCPPSPPTPSRGGSRLHPGGESWCGG